MVEHKAEDRPWAALAARAERGDPGPGSRLFPHPAGSKSRSSFVLLLALFLCGCSQAPRPVAAQPPADCHRTATQRFVLHSDPWINLHHFLFEWARNVPERQPADRRRPVDVPERTRIAQLGEEERQAWERALSFYRERWIARQLVDDEELVDVRDALAAIACAGAGPDRIPAAARAVLTDAMRVYRRHWWPGHHARNLKWIDELRAGLEKHEVALSERLAAAYGGRWPAERIRVDASAYADWTGAYTTRDQVTIASTPDPDFAGLNALELLFHEVSHATFLEEPFLAELEAAFRARGAEVPDNLANLAHVFQFFTPGELLRSRLGGEELRGFRPFAERARVYERGRTTAERELLEEQWVPFLDGETTRAEALARIAAALAPQPTSAWHMGVIAA